MSSLSTKECLRWVVEAGAGPLQHVSPARKAKTKSGRAQTFAAIFTVTDGSLLRGAGTKQLFQALRASIAGRTCAASDKRVAQWFPTLFSKYAFLPVFLNVKFFSSVAQSEMKTVSRGSLQRSNSCTYESPSSF